jgi:hypothetical protein
MEAKANALHCVYAEAQKIKAIHGDLAALLSF